MRTTNLPPRGDRRYTYLAAAIIVAGILISSSLVITRPSESTKTVTQTETQTATQTTIATETVTSTTTLASGPSPFSNATIGLITTVVVENASHFETLTPALDTANGDLYVPVSSQIEVNNFNVSVLSGTTNRVVATIDAPNSPGSPGSPVCDSQNGDIYATGGNATWVISTVTNTMIASVPVASFSAPILDSSDNYLYEVDSNPPSADQGAISVVSGVTNAVITTVTLIGGPGAPAINPVSRELYVPCVSAGIVSIVGPVG